MNKLCRSNIEGCNVIRMDLSSRGGGAGCSIQKSLSHNHKPGFFPNFESIFIDIFLSKSKPVLVGVI